MSTTAPRSSPGDQLIDSCGRTIDHLRLSLTSACDLRCLYCRPGPMDCDTRDELSDDQRLEIVGHLHRHFGLKQVRLTGGEPLLHRGVVRLVENIKDVAPNMAVAMTTHARLLYQMGFELFHAGLDRLNVSLDSLVPGRYRKITGGELDPVLKGIESARYVGFRSIKINTVVLRGVNDSEVVSLTHWALDHDLEIRFLEAMPIGPAANLNRRAFVSAARIKEILKREFDLVPIIRKPGETASRFSIGSGRSRGSVGLIAPVTEPFCGDCRRIRITARGELFPCLLDDRSVELRPAWKGTEFLPKVASERIRTAAAMKRPNGTVQTTRMVTLGG